MYESEERGCEESVELYAVYMRERGGWGRGGSVNMNFVYYKYGVDDFITAE